MLRRLLKPTAGLLAAGALIWAAVSLDFSQYIHLDRIRPMVESMGPYGPLVFVGLCIAAVLLHLPEVVLIAIGGVLFGGVKGFVLGWIGSVAGSTCSFLVARYFMRQAVQRAFTSRFERIRALDERLERKGFQTVLALRLVLFMAPPLNWAIGVTRVRFRDYLLGSALGVTPCIAVTAYAADSIARTNSFSAVFTPGILVPAPIALFLLVLGALAAFRLLR
jgi:uncharacterized membrane protein YdjX (TVP38/TMEM64 family)